VEWDGSRFVRSCKPTWNFLSHRKVYMIRSGLRLTGEVHQKIRQIDLSWNLISCEKL